MSNYSFNYSFNISGNCNTVVNEMAEGVNSLKQNLKEATSFWDSFEGKLLGLNQFTQFFDRLAQSVENMQRPGAELNASLADLQAISNATGKELETIERFARSTAKEFGGSAAQSVESYKLLLSQLSPELTKNSTALAAMGKNVAILSKTMGGDTKAAAEVLTTAMNQYGVSLADPMEASRQMAEMMNIMAAAGREGSAELPTIKLALEQCGMAAKAANVSFAETNAAIQVLDKAGKKGSEGGVALRNVMTTLARGRFLPKDVREELSAAGIDINKLTDNSKSLTERLALLKPVMNDAALFSKLFGRENTNAAMALIQGIDKVDEWTQAITGTNTAVEQSQIIMETYNERMARIQARFDDFKISLFNVSGDFGIWVAVITKSLTPLAQLAPLIMGVGKAIMFVKALNWGKMWGSITHAVNAARISLAFTNGELIRGQFASNGFFVNITRATLGLLRFATVGLWSGIKALGQYILSLVTGGAASTIFAAKAATSFTIFKTAATSACRAVSVAIMNIPIIGWIAAAIAAIIAIGKILWDKCKGFRVFIFTTIELFKAIGRLIWNVISALVQRIVGAFKSIVGKLKSILNSIISAFKTAIEKVKGFFVGIKEWIVGVFSKIWEKLSEFLTPLVDAFRRVANKVKGFFSKIFSWFQEKLYSVINWFIDKYNWLADKLNFDKIARLGKEKADASWDDDHISEDDKFEMPDYNGAGSSGGDGSSDPISKGINGIGGSADKSDRIKNINITIDKLIDTFNIQTTTMQESSERIKSMVAEALLSAVNDVNLAM